MGRTTAAPKSRRSSALNDPSFPLLPHLDAARIRAFYANAPGKEIESGKFASPESSSALAANLWGFFVTAPEVLPVLPGCDGAWWPVCDVTLEAIQRFPWSGGRHPCLDARIETSAAIIGVESKRYEPYRHHGVVDLSDAYWRPVWGEHMEGYCAVRDLLKAEPKRFHHLDAAQLVKHAFGLRTAAQQEQRIAVLLYVYAEPAAWADGSSVGQSLFAKHRSEIESFARMVGGDEVSFAAMSYRELLAPWLNIESLRSHTQAVLDQFKP